jgi:hypothetical protein
VDAQFLHVDTSKEEVDMTQTITMTIDEVALLAAGFAVLVGAGLMPAIAFAARLAVLACKVFACHALIEAIATAGREALKSLLITAAVLFGATYVAAGAWPALAEDRPTPTVAEAPVADLPEAITRTFLLVASKADKPMPVWILDTAVRIYTAYRTYKNGEKVEQATRIAHAALNEIAHVRDGIEAGLYHPGDELRLIRARLEGQADRLERMGQRVDRIELNIEREMKRTSRVMKIVTRRGCQKFEAFDNRIGRCTDRR